MHALSSHVQEINKLVRKCIEEQQGLGKGCLYQPSRKEPLTLALVTRSRVQKCLRVFSSDRHSMYLSGNNVFRLLLGEEAKAATLESCRGGSTLVGDNKDSPRGDGRWLGLRKGNEDFSCMTHSVALANKCDKMGETAQREAGRGTGATGGWAQVSAAKGKSTESHQGAVAGVGHLAGEHGSSLVLPAYQAPGRFCKSALGPISTFCQGRCHALLSHHQNSK